MSDEAENVAALRGAYAAWANSNGCETGCWMGIVADTFLFGTQADSPPGMEYFSTHRTRDELRTYFDGIARDWEMITFEFDEFVAQGDRVVVLGHCAWRHRRTGKVCDTPKADAWRFKGGKVVQYFEYFDTAKMMEAAS